MANVSPSDVHLAINVSEADVPDARLQEMVKRAEVTLELELEEKSTTFLSTRLLGKRCMTKKNSRQ